MSAKSRLTEESLFLHSIRHDTGFLQLDKWRFSQTDPGDCADTFMQLLQVNVFKRQWLLSKHIFVSSLVTFMMTLRLPEFISLSFVSFYLPLSGFLRTPTTNFHSQSQILRTPTHLTHSPTQCVNHHLRQRAHARTHTYRHTRATT